MKKNNRSAYSGAALRQQRDQRLAAATGPEQEARRRAQSIRDGLNSFANAIDQMAEAYNRNDWKTLGYASWQDYCQGEFDQRVRLTVEQRKQAAASLASAGLTKRAAAAALGVSHTTIQNDASGKKLPPPVIEGQVKTDAEVADEVANATAPFDDKYSGDVDSPPVGVPGQTAAEGALVPSADGPSRETASASVVEGPAAGAGLEGSGAGGKPQDPPADSEDKSLRDKVALVAGQPGPPSATTGEAAEPSSTRIEAAVGAQPEIPFSDELEEVEVPPASSSDPDGYDDPAADWMSAWRWLVYAAAEVGKDITDDERAEVRDDLTTIRRLILGES